MSSGQEVGSIFGDGTGPATALLRSPTVIIASIALWGMNVCLFRLFGIDYVYVLTLDLKKEEEENAKKKREKERKKQRRGKHSHSEIPTSEEAAEAIESLSSSSDIGGGGGGSKRGGEVEMSSFSKLKLTSNETFDSEESSRSGELYNVNLSDLSPSSKDAKVDNTSYSGQEVTEVKLIGLAAALITTLYLTSYLWIQVGRGTTIGAIFGFYTFVFLGILIPLPSTAWIRIASKTVLVRAAALLKPRCSCVHGRPRPVPFIDVFFADGMCSMSKVFFDWGMLWLLASHYPHPVPASLQSIIVPSCFASLPYLIRARQCLIMYNVGRLKHDPKRYQHVLNAIKYSTSLFPLLVSAMQKTETGSKIGRPLEILLIVLLAINATYCLLWDIIMDWGMMQKPNAIIEQAFGHCTGMISTSEMKKQPSCLDLTLRPRLRFGTSLTLLVFFLDLFLRFSWTLRFCESYIFPSTDAYILCTEFLEVFRRAVWNLLRVEWEHIKQTGNAMKGNVHNDGKNNDTLLEDDTTITTISTRSSPTNDTIMSRSRGSSRDRVA